MATDFPETPLRDLDPRERKFVQGYVYSTKWRNNAPGAAKAAGYSLDMIEHEVQHWIVDPGQFLNPRPHVWEAIKFEQMVRDSREALTPEKVIDEIAKLAFASASEYTGVTSQGDPYTDLTMLSEDGWAAIAGVEIEDYQEGRGEDARTVKKIKVKNYDKRGALDLLTKVMGMQKTIHSNDPVNPMPGNMGSMPIIDLTRLTLEEAEVFIPLLKKACLPEEPEGATIEHRLSLS